MDKYEISRRIEEFAPLETAEPWDCSGWLVETAGKDVSRVMLALTVTEDILSQAREQNCDMIISHHPLFFVPIGFKDIDIYCAHTNLDLAKGGTTDTLITRLGLEAAFADGFLRYVEGDVKFGAFIQKLKKISTNMRYTNPKHVEILKKISFCAGSGSEFIKDAAENGADALVTGDLKFHPALESPIAVFDIGHFESEIQVLNVFKELINNDVEVLVAKESSPFRI